MNSASFLSMQLQISALPPPLESLELKLTEFQDLSKARRVKEGRDAGLPCAVCLFVWTVQRAGERSLSRTFLNCSTAIFLFLSLFPSLPGFIACGGLVHSAVPWIRVSKCADLFQDWYPRTGVCQQAYATY